MKRALKISVLTLVLLPLAFFSWLLTTESGLHWSYGYISDVIPGQLSLQQLKGRLVGPVTATGLQYRNQGVVVKGKQLAFDWSPFRMLAGQLIVDRLHLVGLEVMLPPDAAADEQQTVTRRLPDVALPWRTVLEDISIDGVSVQQGDKQYALKRMELVATALLGQLDIDTLKLQADNYSLNVSGELSPSGYYEHHLRTDWQITLPSKAILKGKGRVQGNTLNSRLQQTVTGPLQLELEAQVKNILQQLQWQADIQARGGNLSLLNAAIPAAKGEITLAAQGDLKRAGLKGSLKADHQQTGELSGEFQLQVVNDGLLVEQLQLHSALHQTHLQVRGLWQPAGTDPPDSSQEQGGHFDLAMNWHKLRWPLTGTPWFDSKVGSAWLRGSLRDYRFGLASEQPWPQAPPSFWYAAARGNLQGMEFDSLRISALDGEANVSGQLAWSPRLLWQARATFTGVDPGSLWPQWPGKLKGRFNSSGRVQQGQLLVENDNIRIEGELRQYPLHTQAQVNWRDKGLEIKQLDVRSAKAKLSVSGRAGEQLALDWRLRAPDLAALYPQAGGELNAQGKLGGYVQAPLVSAVFQGKSLVLQDAAIATVDGDVAIDMAAWHRSRGKLALQELRYQSYQVKSLDVMAKGNNIKASLVSPALRAQFILQGEAGARSWRGRVQTADLTLRQSDTWRLRQAAELVITEDSLNTEALCWLNGQAELCASLQNRAGRWHTVMNAQRFPLGLLEPWLPANLQLKGLVNADANLNLQAPGDLYGSAHIQLSDGTLYYPLLEGERDSWQYAGGNIDIGINESGVLAETRIVLHDSDTLTGRFSLPKARVLALSPAQQPLRGEAQIQLSDLGLVEALLPEVRDVKGKLALGLSAGGTLAQPRFGLKANLANGALRIPRLGLKIDTLTFNAHSENLGVMDYQLSARSGGGTLNAKGQASLDAVAGWSTRLNIEGQDFVVSHIPEAHVQITPQLGITVQPHHINVQGKLHIPYARLQPKDISTAATVSHDVVIIGQEQVREKPWVIQSAVRISLGERVHFNGFGFEGRLGGDLLLKEEQGQATAASGQITVVEGYYRAYGQRLEIEHGRLLYAGGPLLQPGLDIRAVRRVATVTAGLKVKGNLDQPQIELFSVPAMGQTEALSYLLLGHSIESASRDDGAMMAKASLALRLASSDRLVRILGERFGLEEMRLETSETSEQTSLVLGRYLSPKLYISYGVGLVESVNELSLRYQISEHWQLKGVSGEHQGADLMYIIER